MSLNFGLGFMFTAQDLASGVMKNIKSNFDGLQQSAGKNVANLDKMVQGMSSGLATTAAGIGGLMTSFHLAKASADVETQLLRVKNVLDGTPEQIASDLAEIKDWSLEVATSLGMMPVQALEAFEALGQQGFKKAKALQMAEPILKFAKVSKLAMEDAVNMPAQLMRSFEIPAEGMPKILDQIAGAAKESSANIGDYTIGISRALAGVAMSNADLTDTLGIFGLYKDILGSPMVAGTALSYTLQTLTNEKKRNIVAGKLLVPVIDKETGAFRKTTDVLGDMFDALSRQDEVSRRDIMGEIFGMEALKGMNAFIKRLNAGVEGAGGVMETGRKALDLSIQKVAGQADTIDQQYANRMSGLEGKLDKVTAKFKEFAVRIGDPMSDVLKPLVDGAAEQLSRLSGWVKNLDPEFKKTAAAIFLGASAFLAISGGVGILVAAFPLIVAGAELIGSALVSMFAGIFLASLPLTITFIALGAIIYAIWNNLGGLGDTWKQFTGWLTQSGGVFEKIGTFISETWTAISEGFSETWTQFESVFGYLNAGLQAITHAFSELFGALFEGSDRS
jgi:TP901 family phage tail tape measure protein